MANTDREEKTMLAEEALWQWAREATKPEHREATERLLAGLADRLSDAAEAAEATEEAEASLATLLTALLAVAEA